MPKALKLIRTEHMLTPTVRTSTDLTYLLCKFVELNSKYSEYSRQMCVVLQELQGQ